MRFRISRGESNHNPMSKSLGMIFKIMDSKLFMIKWYVGGPYFHEYGDLGSDTMPDSSKPARVFGGDSICSGKLFKLGDF